MTKMPPALHRKWWPIRQMFSFALRMVFLGLVIILATPIGERKKILHRKMRTIREPICQAVTQNAISSNHDTIIQLSFLFCIFAGTLGAILTRIEGKMKRPNRVDRGW